MARCRSRRRSRWHAASLQSALLGNLRSRPECLAAGSTSPTLHRRISAQKICAARRWRRPAITTFALRHAQSEAAPSAAFSTTLIAPREVGRPAHGRWVHSGEHTWVNSRERQSHPAGAFELLGLTVNFVRQAKRPIGQFVSQINYFPSFDAGNFRLASAVRCAALAAPCALASLGGQPFASACLSSPTYNERYICIS